MVVVFMSLCKNKIHVNEKYNIIKNSAIVMFFESFEFLKKTRCSKHLIQSYRVEYRNF